MQGFKVRTGLCPCGSNSAYDQCCGRWHTGEAAPTAEALMRSRYVAFVMENESYLLSSWHPRTRPAAVPFERGTKWLGLKVIETLAVSADSADVEFIARFRVGGGSAARIHERSRFIREAGRWLYVDGDARSR